MRRLVVASMPRGSLDALVLMIAACLLWPAAARASGDIGCTAQRKLRHHDFTGCDDMAMLSPGNDTRVNLVLLLARGDRRSPTGPRDVPPPGPLFDWPTFESWTSASEDAVGDDTHAAGEGSRCLSDTDGKAAFAAALDTAKGIKAAEKAALIAARRDLRPTCNDAAPGAVAIASVAVSASTRSGKEFAIYLQGASAFYAGDFAAATARFAALGRSGDDWLRETSRYMLARVDVNRAQVGLFDEYGARDDKKVDEQAVAAAEAGLRAYLRSYPAGRYAASARGLLRRVYWLGGDTVKLAAQYAALFAQSPDARGLDDASLAEEVDTKLLPQLTPADTTDPTLLAVLDLQTMRGDDKQSADTSTLTRETLAAQRAQFARQPALFDFLLATRAFYIDKDARAVLRLLGDAARQPSFDTLEFSRQMLRGMALDATGDRNTRAFWLEMIPGTAPPFQRPTLELALALRDERTAGLDRVFAAGSPIHDETIRDVLIAHVAGAALLRRQAGGTGVSMHERTAALFTLLYKDLTRGAYRDFVADVAAVPANAPGRSDVYDFVGSSDPPVGIFTTGATKDEFPCPGLRETASRLAADPRAADARLCIAEFIRIHGLDDYFLDQPPPPDELGGTPSLFPGPAFSRLETYKAVIGTPGAPASAKAYALFRAINCYAPSQMNGCGGEDVAPSVRKGWFQRLHREFPASRWAQESVYYW